MEKKHKYLRTQKNQTKSEDNCPVCDKNLYWDEDTTQRVGLLDEDNRIEGWMCPFCKSHFDLNDNLVNINHEAIMVGRA